MYVVIQRDKRTIAIHDAKTGVALTFNYIPEDIKSAQVLSKDEIVVYCEKSVIILRRYSPTSRNFSIYSRRNLY